MNTSLPKDPQFNKYYEKHGKYLRLKGLRPKTIEAYARVIRRIGNYFDARICYAAKGSKQNTTSLPLDVLLIKASDSFNVQDIF